MQTEIIGREEEILTLNEFLGSKKSEFLAIYGRRRIGKTFLIRTFFHGIKNITFFHSTGAKDGALKEQITHFTQRIGDTFLGGVMPKQGKNWDETFKILTDSIKSSHPDKKIVIFMDELPWMATKNSRLLESLDPCLV